MEIIGKKTLDYSESIINTVREPLIVLDQDLRVVTVSRSFYEFFKVKPEDTVGQLIYDLGNKQWNIPKLRELLETILPQKTTFEDYEVEHDFATIGRRIMLLNARQIEQASGRERIILLAIEDITERRAVEAGLEHAREATEQAAKAKSDFLANMSHEIRTPLNGIIGLNNLILRTSLNPLQKDYMMKAQQSSKGLLNIINDILDYSKIEAGKLQFEEKAFSIETLMRNIANLFEYSIMHKSIEIHIDIHPNTPQVLIGDSLRLQQVFNNLVSNAVKFTEAGDITIRIKPIAETQTHIELQCAVVDTGIGMNEKEQAKLFQAFSQTDTSNTRKYGGTGLGLTICKQLTELMGGRIWQESTKIKGSTFYFTVQLQKDTSVAASILDTSYLVDQRFLVVDDNQLERELIGSILSFWGANPTLCGSGEEAILLAEKHPYDYMLIDWKMPNIDGLDVIQTLHEKLKTTFPKVIMITAHIKGELLQASATRHISIDNILHKPVTPAVLFKSITQTDMPDELETMGIDKRFVIQGNVLVVEDNEINQLVARDLLESYGLNISMAWNGAEAVEKVKNGSYDLIMMDLQMPIMDGYEATRQIRKFNRDIPIVALSAAVMEHDKKLTMDVGMNDHLAKPIDMIELEHLLKYYFKNKLIEENIVVEKIDSLYGINMIELSKKITKPENIKRFLQLFADGNRDFSLKLASAPIGSAEHKQLIHTLKGVSGNISATKVYEIVKAIDESDDEGIKRKLIPDLTEELNNVIFAIDQRFPKTVFLSHQNTDIQTMHSIIQDIILKLENKKFIDDQQLNDCLVKLGQFVNQETVEKMNDAVGMFEYEIAIQLFQNAQEQLHG